MDLSGQFRGPAALRSGRQGRYPLNWSLGGPQYQSGLFGVEKNQPLPGRYLHKMEKVAFEKCSKTDWAYTTSLVFIFGIVLNCL